MKNFHETKLFIEFKWLIHPPRLHLILLTFCSFRYNITKNNMEYGNLSGILNLDCHSAKNFRWIVELVWELYLCCIQTKQPYEAWKINTILSILHPTTLEKLLLYIFKYIGMYIQNFQTNWICVFRFTIYFTLIHWTVWTDWSAPHLHMQNVIYIKCCALIHEMENRSKGIQYVNTAFSGGIHSEKNERVYIKFKHFFIFISLWMLKALYLF